jgi:hypothetical protein
MKRGITVVLAWLRASRASLHAWSRNAGSDPAWLAHEYFDDNVNKLADVARSERGILTLHEAPLAETACTRGSQGGTTPVARKTGVLIRNLGTVLRIR